MTRFSLLSTASLAALTLAAPLHADVTAEDIWGDWQSYMSTYGYEMTGTESRSGDTLTVSSVSMSFDMTDSDTDEAAGVMSITVPAMIFTENGDGTVSMTMPGESTIVFESADGADDDVRATVTLSQPGFEMTASGDPEAVDYVYSADSMTMALSELIIDGEVRPPEAMTAEMALMDVSGETTLRVGALRTYDQSFTSQGVTVNVDFSDPSGTETGEIDFNAGGLSFSGESTIPDMEIGDEVAAALRAGFAFDGNFALTDSASNIVITGSEPFTAKTSADSTEYRVAMGAESGLAYDITHSGVAIDMLLPDVPMPITAQMASSTFQLGLPVVKSDDPQDFGLTLELNELEVADTLWAMIDPQGQLPRDPATLQVSLDGMAKLLFDYLDPEEAEAIGASGAMPAELQSVNLSNLVVSAAGAALTGNGAFTVTPGMSPIFGPLGTPVGQVDLQLEGGNGLMDTLVAMQLVAEEQVMGARMMMGLFARPGDGPDTLVSTIEINEEGQILANGQRIQ